MAEMTVFPTLSYTSPIVKSYPMMKNIKINIEEGSKADFAVGNVYFLFNTNISEGTAFLLKYSEILVYEPCFFCSILPLIVACSRLSDSGEDVKVKGTRKVVGAGKRKEEVSSRFIFVFARAISV